MRILILSATQMEIAPLFPQICNGKADFSGWEFEPLVSGVGPVQAAYALSKSISNYRPALVIAAGIAGSFSVKFPPGTVVAVRSELFADTGVWEKQTFKDLFDLGLADPNEYPYRQGRLLYNLPLHPALSIPQADACTVSQISTQRESIEMMKLKYNPGIESMEGAAYQYVCMMEKIPFLQIRSISNYVGIRDKSEWKMNESIQALNETLGTIIQNDDLLSTLVNHREPA